MRRTQGGRCMQVMVPMRDGVRLNTFVHLPDDGGRRYPVILQRTPYGIAAAPGAAGRDCTRAWLPAQDAPLRGALLRGWRAIVERGYACVTQDTRGRNGSEGEDRVYADDADDGRDTLDWISDQAWCNGRIGMSGSSAAATTTFAAASLGHPNLRAFFAQVGGSSIYDDVVYEGNAIEMERLWLWVGQNISGLSATHRERARRRAGLSGDEFEHCAKRAQQRWERLSRAAQARPPFIEDPDWMRLPLLHYPDFCLWQPFLDEVLSHPAPDGFRAAHDYRRTIGIPGFHATTWYDVFLGSVIAAYQELQERVGRQRLWIGPNHHYFIYEQRFWPRDPYFEWFDHWLKDARTPLLDEPPVYYSPRAWVEDESRYTADDWRTADHWPPSGCVTMTLFLRGDGTLGRSPGGGRRSYRYDPRRPVPTLGGRNMLIPAGQHDQQSLRSQPDYGLVYCGEALPGALTIAGEVTAFLHVESDAPDTDFVVKLLEITTDGRALLLMDGVARAMFRDAGNSRDAREPDGQRTPPRSASARGAGHPLRAGEIVRVSMSLCHLHHIVAAGHRLAVDVCSSNFPRRARNTNSGHALLAADGEEDIRSATNAVHHDAAAPSWIEISILRE